MGQGCKRPTCYAPETPCQLGEGSLRDCAEWSGRVSGTSGESHTDQSDPDSPSLAWSGNSFGTVDLSYVVGRSSPTVIGLVGPHNSGKTTILAAFYLLLGRGGFRLDGYQFAGSYTLEGWENIAHSLRWEDSSTGPSFPHHTSCGEGRRPGLLHLALRQREGRLKDFLFADSPGEWFSKWAINSDCAAATGAKWIVDQSDVFVLMADCEALAPNNQERGRARNDLNLLAQRLGHEQAGRPAALAWSKSDLRISQEIRQSIRENVERSFSGINEFSVSVYGSQTNGDEKQANKPGIDFWDLFKWILDVQSPSISFPAQRPVLDDSLSHYSR